MFEIPGSDIVSVHVTEECVKGKSQPVYIKGKAIGVDHNTHPFEMRAEAK